MRQRCAVLAALLLALAALPGSARAEFGIAPASFEVALLNASGQPELRAGAHPDRLVARFAFSTHADGTADGNVRDITIDLPPGLAGDAAATPACERRAFAENRCDPASQVGVLQATFAGIAIPLTFPLYNVVPREDGFAELGAIALVAPVRLTMRLREESDYGTQIQLVDLPQSVPLVAAQVELWGIPADHQSGTTIPRKALLTTSTACDVPLTNGLRARSWQQPDRWHQATSQPAGSLTGCDQLSFAPLLNASLDTPAADTPSGLVLAVTLPQQDDPDARVPSQAASLTVTLPGGLTLSPGVASGLGTCDDAAFGLGTAAAPRCPDAAKLGSVELTTPVLAEPLTGAIYFGRPLPSERFPLLVAATGRGVMLKLAGSLRPDPSSGRVSIVIDDVPALPFSHFQLHFRDGPRAPLATPPSCGPAAVTASLAARRGGAPVRRAAILELTTGPAGTPCTPTAPFAPRFEAGSSRAVAGSSGPFSVTVTRADGEQLLERLALTLPIGVSARLASVARCPTLLAVRNACPASSRVGSVAVEAGAGQQPIPLRGDVYLTDGHAGAPFGFALTLDGRVGPIQLGSVVVLATLRLDPADARVIVETDPLPQLLGGVPLRLRTVALDIDRRGFVRNATSCVPRSATGVFSSLDATTARADVRYALGGCARLRFAPKVAMRLGPRRELSRSGRPTVTIALRSRLGQAAVRSATVQLPRALVLDPPLSTTVCPQLRARDGRCPPASAVGTARVRTPLLPGPLVGTIDVVQPRRGVQPELWTTVRGSGVRLSLRATTSARAGGPITTRFLDLPDLPLSSLRLTLDGGSDGLLRVVSRDLCGSGAPRRALFRARLHGHNGATRALRIGAASAC